MTSWVSVYCNGDKKPTSHKEGDDPRTMPLVRWEPLSNLPVLRTPPEMARAGAWCVSFCHWYALQSYTTLLSILPISLSVN